MIVQPLQCIIFNVNILRGEPYGDASHFHGFPSGHQKGPCEKYSFVT